MSCRRQQRQSSDMVRLLLHLFKAEGEADLQRVQICLLISALRMPVPKVRGTNICWIVSYISELRTYLTFFVGSNRTIVFCGDLDFSIFTGLQKVFGIHTVFDG